VRKKTRTRMREFASQIPSPFIHSRDVWKNVVRDAWCPHPPPLSTLTLTRGPGVRRSVSMGQQVGNPRRQCAPQMLCAVRESRVGSGTVAVIASAPTTPTAP
jgi:hypothetical protein